MSLNCDSAPRRSLPAGHPTREGFQPYRQASGRRLRAESRRARCRLAACRLAGLHPTTSLSPTGGMRGRMLPCGSHCQLHEVHVPMSSYMTKGSLERRRPAPSRRRARRRRSRGRPTAPAKRGDGATSVVLRQRARTSVGAWLHSSRSTATAMILEESPGGIDHQGGEEAATSCEATVRRRGQQRGSENTMVEAHRAPSTYARSPTGRSRRLRRGRHPAGACVLRAGHDEPQRPTACAGPRSKPVGD